jgi:hypothetical protein
MLCYWRKSSTADICNGDDTWLWSTGGMILTRENRMTQEKKNPVPPQCHFVHHKSQMDWPGMELGPLSWKPCWQHVWYRHDNLTEQHDVTISLYSNIWNGKTGRTLPALATKAYGWTEEYLHSFISCNKWRCLATKNNAGTDYIEKWVGPRTRHDIFFAPAGIQTPDGPTRSLVTIMTMLSGALIYHIFRPIRRTFFPEKCDLNSTCVLCAEGKYYFQTYKYPYSYYTASLSWDSEICFQIMRSGITAYERLTFS